MYLWLPGEPLARISFRVNDAYGTVEAADDLQIILGNSRLKVYHDVTRFCFEDSYVLIFIPFAKNNVFLFLFSKSLFFRFLLKSIIFSYL